MTVGTAANTSTVAGDGSVGTDTLQNIDSIVGTSGNDVLSFANSTMSINQFRNFIELEGRGGNDYIIGNGNTRISYRTAASGVTVDLAAGTGQSTALGDSAGVGVDTLTNVNAIRRSAHDDTLSGSDRTDVTETFRGLAGNDFIDGRGGQDRLDYNGSNSGVVVTLDGGDGNDTLNGGAGADAIGGGIGTDVAEFSGPRLVVREIARSR